MMNTSFLFCISPFNLVMQIIAWLPIVSSCAKDPPLKEGRRPNGFLGLSLHERTILFLVILLDKTVSVG